MDPTAPITIEDTIDRQEIRHVYQNLYTRRSDVQSAGIKLLCEIWLQLQQNIAQNDHFQNDCLSGDLIEIVTFLCDTSRFYQSFKA